jgi:glucose-1-phosphate cytidylyltransferase
MQVVILCGGLGTRMREETEFRPKPMVPIGTRPILWHVMKYYASHGHCDFVLCLGYKGDVIKEYFFHYDLMNSDVTLDLGNPSQLEVHQAHDEASWTVTLAETGLATLKGARLKRVQRYLRDDTFLMTYGDGLTDVDIGDLLAFHRSHGKIATVTGVNATSQFGELTVDGARVTGFLEKPKALNALVNGGYFVFDRRIFDFLTDDEDCDLEVGALPAVAAAGELMVYSHAGNWACMDTLRDRERLNRMWDRGQAFWKKW